MAIAEPLESVEEIRSQPDAAPHIHKRAAGSAFRKPEGDDHELSTENLSNLLRRVAKTSIAEIDKLIGELQMLRRKLQSDGDRIQADVATHAELNQQVMQLTTIISDSVKKLPSTSPISR